MSQDSLQRFCSAMTILKGRKRKQSQRVIKIGDHSLHHFPLNAGLLTSQNSPLDVMLLTRSDCKFTKRKGASLVTQMVKYLPAMQEMHIHSLEKEPWSWKWQPTPVFLPGEFHRERSLVGYSLWIANSKTQLNS